MHTKTASQRKAEALEQARRHWQERYRAAVASGSFPAEPLPPFTIAISREAGANGPAIARGVRKRLGWPVYDKELLQMIADEMGLHVKLIESVDEKQTSWLQECLQTLSPAPGVSEPAFVRHLGEMLLSLAAHGKCVIVGRGAAAVLPAETTLRVRLLGPARERIEAIRQRFGIPREEAEQWVEKTDRERVRFVRDHFHKDPNDPRHYDLVLNSSRFTVGECADFIVEALRRLQVKATALTPALSC